MSSTKLSVTLNRRLSAKYGTGMARVQAAVQAWIAADVQRGMVVHHVALDDAAEMARYQLQPLQGTPTARKVKAKVDALWRQLAPDYLVLFGGHDVLPMFEVPNPTRSARGDGDPIVPTDNPYACSKPFKAGVIESYLVPDRVVGRIPDMLGDPDPAWIEAALATCVRHKPRRPDFYAKAFAACCDEWKAAGRECMLHIGQAAPTMLVSPPSKDGSAALRKALSRPLHMVKCHGAQLDPNFYGQKGDRFPISLHSRTLKSRLPRGTLAAAMCCYGAQIYDPLDPAATQSGSWPVASTYLRQGAVGFVGATMIAWVGAETMLCADWIVAQFLKAAAAGASTGRALLESKQDYLRWLTQQGESADLPDQKTLIEFVLLGDPSLHPVAAVTPGPKGVVAAALHGGVAAARRQRRQFRTAMATGIRDTLPRRTEIRSAPAGSGLDRQARQLAGADFRSFDMQRMPTVIEVSRPAAAPVAASIGRRRVAATRAVPRQAKTYEYYWTGRRDAGPVQLIQLVRIEADAEGRVLRASVVHASRGIQKTETSDSS